MVPTSVSRALLVGIGQHLLVAFLQLGQTKVEKLHAVARQHDVAGLEISVHDAVPMRVVQGVGDPDRGAQRERQRQRAVFQPLGEGRALDILHHQKDGRTVFTDVMKRADIRMRDAGDGASFVAEPFDPAARRVDELAREQLDGDGPIEPRIARAVDFTHSPGAEQCQDLERAKAGAGVEPHSSPPKYTGLPPRVSGASFGPLGGASFPNGYSASAARPRTFPPDSTRRRGLPTRTDDSDLTTRADD